MYIYIYKLVKQNLTFLMLGSSHSYHRALHCLADFLCNNDAILAHWFFPYFITAAFNISSYSSGTVLKIEMHINIHVLYM